MYDNIHAIQKFVYLGSLGTVFGLFIMHDMSDLRAWDDRGDKLRDRDVMVAQCDECLPGMHRVTVEGV